VWVAVHAVGSPSGTGVIVRLLVGVLVGVVVFGIGVIVLRVDEISSLRARLARPRTDR
jgi:hypothetical protein